MPYNPPIKTDPEQTSQTESDARPVFNLVQLKRTPPPPLESLPGIRYARLPELPGGQPFAGWQVRR